MKIRTVAAILVWLAVALLLLNRVYKVEWILPISIVTTVIAVLLYFSPLLRKAKTRADKEENLPPSEPNRVYQVFLSIPMLGCSFPHSCVELCPLG